MKLNFKIETLRWFLVAGLVVGCGGDDLQVIQDDLRDAPLARASRQHPSNPIPIPARPRSAVIGIGAGEVAVTEGEDPPDEEGGVRRYLHGRSRRVTAQVGVRTRVGALETRVWILWRVRS